MWAAIREKNDLQLFLGYSHYFPSGPHVPEVLSILENRWVKPAAAARDAVALLDLYDQIPGDTHGGISLRDRIHGEIALIFKDTLERAKKLGSPSKTGEENQFFRLISFFQNKVDLSLPLVWLSPSPLPDRPIEVPTFRESTGSPTLDVKTQIIPTSVFALQTSLNSVCRARVMKLSDPRNSRRQPWEAQWGLMIRVDRKEESQTPFPGRIPEDEAPARFLGSGSMGPEPPGGSGSTKDPKRPGGTGVMLVSLEAHLHLPDSYAGPKSPEFDPTTCQVKGCFRGRLEKVRLETPNNDPLCGYAILASEVIRILGIDPEGGAGQCFGKDSMR